MSHEHQLNDREIFEAWCAINCSPHGSSSAWYWEIWKAGRDSGIATERERAAKQLDALGCDHCATAIRNIGIK